MLTNRLPNLRPHNSPPPWNGPDFTGRRATNTRFQFLGIRKYFSDSGREEIHFSLKSDIMVDVRFELTTNDSCPAVDAICEGRSPLG